MTHWLNLHIRNVWLLFCILFVFSIVLNGNWKEENINISQYIQCCMVVTDVLCKKKKKEFYTLQRLAGLEVKTRYLFSWCNPMHAYSKLNPIEFDVTSRLSVYLGFQPKLPTTQGRTRLGFTFLLVPATVSSSTRENDLSIM